MKVSHTEWVEQGSKGQKMFVSVLQRLLTERGLKVKESTAIEFYQFLMKVSPWFPEEEGTVLVPTAVRKELYLKGSPGSLWEEVPTTRRA